MIARTTRDRPGTQAPRRMWPGSSPVADFTQHQIERALRHRVRYRYVRPRVAHEADGYRIESPCCSRNVDRDGGVIDIAWFTHDADGMWHLHARDHVLHEWTEQCASVDLTALLDMLCVDAARVFWP